MNEILTCVVGQRRYRRRMAAGWTQPTTPSEAALAEVRRIFAQRHAEAHAPSTVYGLLANGELIDGAGFGTIDDAGNAPTLDTAYRIASITKSFTAAALLLLRDRDLVDLDEAITAIVPALVLRGPAGDGAPVVPTLRMLLTMSGGLASDDPWADRQESLTDAEFDDVIGGGVRLVSVAGTTFEYSNLGYALLGRVIQERSGRSFHEFVTDELLVPLGLGATGWDAPVDAAGGIATGFERVGDAWAPVPLSGPGAFSPIGGLCSTVSDLCTWMQWFVDADLTDCSADGPLDAVSRREMQQGQRLRPVEPLPGDRSPRAAYGFGLVEQCDDGGTVVYHSGGYPGFSSHIRWHPATGIGIVALENATYSGAARPAAESMRAILDTLGPSTYADPTARPLPETLRAQQDVMRLVRDGWDDALAHRLFTDTVALDAPLARRRTELAAALDRAGALGDVVEESSDSPTNRQWTVRGAHADLVIDISLHPLDPPRVQWFDVEVRDC